MPDELGERLDARTTRKHLACGCLEATAVLVEQLHASVHERSELLLQGEA